MSRSSTSRGRRPARHASGTSPTRRIRRARRVLPRAPNGGRASSSSRGCVAHWSAGSRSRELGRSCSEESGTRFVAGIESLLAQDGRRLLRTVGHRCSHRGGTSGSASGSALPLARLSSSEGDSRRTATSRRLESLGSSRCVGPLRRDFRRGHARVIAASTPRMHRLRPHSRAAGSRTQRRARERHRGLDRSCVGVLRASSRRSSRGSLVGRTHDPDAPGAVSALPRRPSTRSLAAATRLRLVRSAATAAGRLRDRAVAPGSHRHAWSRIRRGRSRALQAPRVKLE